MLTCISFSYTLPHLWGPKLYSSVRHDGPKSRSTASSLTIGPTSSPHPLQTWTPNGQNWVKTKPWLLQPWVPHHSVLPLRDCTACAWGPLWPSMAWGPEPACCESCKACPPPLAGVLPDCPLPLALLAPRATRLPCPCCTPIDADVHSHLADSFRSGNTANAKQNQKIYSPLHAPKCMCARPTVCDKFQE